MKKLIVSLQFLLFFCLTTHAQQSVSWTDIVNLQVSGDTLKKNSTLSGWNAGAASSKVLNPNVDGWVETTVLEANTDRRFGLSIVNLDEGPSTINYAISFGNNGYLYVHENGTQKGIFGAYGTGEVFRVERVGNEIQYKRDGVVFRTVQTGPNAPLLVDVAFNQTNSTLYHVNVSDSFDTPEIPPATNAVVWTDMVGVSESEGILSKTSSLAGWNAGAASTKVLNPNVDGWVETTALEANTDRRFGLSIVNLDEGPSTINYAISFGNNGYLYVHENGTQKGIFGVYGSGEVFRVERVGNEIQYKRDGVVFRTVQTGSNAPLLVDVAFNQTNSTLYKVNVSDSFNTPEVPPATNTVVWSDIVGVSESGAILSKTSSLAGWNAGSASSKVLNPNVDGWVETTVLETNTQRFMGLSILNRDESYSTINYSIYFQSNGTFNVHENGSDRGSFGAYGSGEVFRVERVGNEIQYKRDGVVFRTVQTGPNAPLLVDVAFNQTNSTLYKVNVSDSFNTPEVPPATNTVVWSDIVGVSESGAILSKTSSLAGWNAGSASSKVLNPNIDGWVETTVLETNTQRFMGLSILNRDESYSTINYSIYFQSNGTFNVHENGSDRGSFGAYGSGEVFRVERVGNEIQYKRDGVVFRTVQTGPNAPLLVDVAFNQTNSTLYKVNVSDSFDTPEVPPATNTVVWSDIVGVSESGAILSKTSSLAGWNAGSASSKVLNPNIDGWVETTVLETNTQRFMGLSILNRDESYSTINYSIYFQSNGTFNVHENGSDRGSFGAYGSGEVFRVERVGNEIQYKRDGVVFRTVQTGPNAPLLVDVAFNQTNSTLYKVNVSDSFDTPEVPPMTNSVNWTDIVGLSLSDNLLISDSDGSWGNNGAASIQLLSPNINGWVEVMSLETNKSRLFGLSTSNTDAHYNTIGYAINLGSGGTIQVFENGTNKGDYGAYQTGAILRVERDGNKIFYKKDGITFRSVTVDSTDSLQVDVAFSDRGVTLYNVNISDSFAGQTASSPVNPMDWTDIVNLQLSGDTLKKNSTLSGWNAGAASSKVLNPNVDGWVESTVLETNTDRVFGLSVLNWDADYKKILFAISLKNDGTFEIYENGTSLGNFGVYSAGQVFRVERHNGSILYKQEGEIIMTTPIAPTIPLLVDFSLHTLGATLYKVSISDSFDTAIAPEPSNSVAWKDVVGVFEDDDILTNPSSHHSWTGAASTKVLNPGVDGWVESTVLETNKSRAFGLSIFNLDSDVKSLHYAIYLSSSGAYHIYENGVIKTTLDYATGDVFRVARFGNEIQYIRNGIVVETSQTVSHVPLLVDISIYHYSPTLYKVRVSDSFDVPIIPESYNSLNWTDVVGLDFSNDVLKSTSGNWGNSGAASSEVLSPNTDGWVETTAIQTKKERIIGLSKINTDANYTTIDYGIHLSKYGTINVYESGGLKGNFGFYILGNVFRIERNGSQINYSKDGIVFKSSEVDPSDSLLVDLALKDIHASLYNINVSDSFLGIGNGPIDDQTSPNSESSEGVIFIDSLGNVGIHTEQPQETLHVAGTAKIDSTLKVSAIYFEGDSSTLTSASPSLWTRDSTDLKYLEGSIFTKDGSSMEWNQAYDTLLNRKNLWDSAYVQRLSQVSLFGLNYDAQANSLSVNAEASTPWSLSNGFLNYSGSISAHEGNSSQWQQAYIERGSQIAGNGLTWNGSEIGLGGSLTTDTDIVLSNQSFMLRDTTHLSSISIIGMAGNHDPTGFNYFSNVVGMMNLTDSEEVALLGINRGNSAVQISSTDRAGQNGFGVQFFKHYGTLMFGLKDGDQTRVHIKPQGSVEILDEINEAGAYYSQDYSGNFTERSLVDKGYTDSHISGKPSSMIRALNAGSGPGLSEDGMSLVWSNSVGEYVLSPLDTISPWIQSGGNITFSSGNVGIGTTAIPSGFALAVSGDVLAKRIKVIAEDVNWPDYVFESRYSKMSLHNLDKYIRKNKHLPGIPSAQEVQEEGIDLGSMDARLLEKIEELTLYLIELKRENEKLIDRIEKLEKK